MHRFCRKTCGGKSHRDNSLQKVRRLGRIKGIMFGISVLKAYKHFSELSPTFKAPTVLNIFYTSFSFTSFSPQPQLLSIGSLGGRNATKWYILLSLMNARLKIQLCLRNPVAFNKFSYYNLMWVSIFFQCFKPWSLSECSPRAEKQPMPVFLP